MKHSTQQSNIIELFTQDTHECSAEEALPSLREALGHSSIALRTFAVCRLSSLGRRATTETVEKLERMAEASPHDIAVRILLVSFYWRLRSLSIEYGQALQRHVYSIVSTCPESEFAGSAEICVDPNDDRVAYTRLRELWLKHVGTFPDNKTILDHAARFFALSEPGLSKHLLELARKLEPSNPEWLRRIAHLEMLGLQSQSKEVRRAKARSAMINLENAISSMKTQEQRSRLLTELGKAAFEAGELEKASAYASELLNSVSRESIQGDVGDSVHRVNTILGRIALAEGNKDRAKTHLIESARVSPTPVLQSFGPSMQLAHELLQLGERQVVIDYLNMCASFWKPPDHICEKWIYAIVHGELPDFGPNLAY
jgi:hypothetical protein